MPYPSEPSKIVLKNSVYPNGLTALDIHSYYLRNKNRILKYAEMKKVVLFLSFDADNELVVRRNNKDNTPIILSNINYNEIITGYNISIAMETDLTTEYYVVDIDVKGNIPEIYVKRAASEVENAFKTEKFIKNTLITNSTTGYHVYGFLKGKEHIDRARTNMLAILKNKVPNRYIYGRTTSLTNAILLDPSPMYKRGSITIPNALTRQGLICGEITDINKFDRRRMKIRNDN